jgi:tRNA-uridine 2-sulfurtransferase
MKVALGMSGGVDSSLAAHLLVEQGYEVTGVYLECWRAPGCRTDEDRKDALQVALGLNIPFQVLDFKEAYRQQVVEYFFNEYQAGRTPNPDVMCNKEIKFGLFYNWAMSNGFDYVATGHYAQSDTSQGQLLTSADSFKDQTYFLYLLKQDQLKKILFPVGGLTKRQVREEAQRRNISVAAKKDSVGICFIGDINVFEFLKERLGENPGEVVDVEGNVIGKHNGLWFYTVGQRHGFTVNNTLVKESEGKIVEKTLMPPFYVIDKIADKNQLVVGFGAQTFKSEIKATQLHWISGTPEIDQQLQIRIRHTGELVPAKITFPNTSQKSTEAKIEFSQPLKGVAEGQSIVFYTPESTDSQRLVCLGGGIISH